MIKQIEITRENFDLALKIQNEIFPQQNAKINYLESINNITNNKYYLLYVDKTCVGISGLYCYDIDKTSAWLGWFGILKEYRNNGYGSQALNLFELNAQKQGYTHTRIYTDKLNNDIAINFYKKNGYSMENYDNEPTITKLYPILIFSKNIVNKKLENWENKFIDLAGQINKQKG